MLEIVRKDKRRIGEILVQDFEISKDIIDKILILSKQKKKRFIKTAMEEKLVSYEFLISAFLKQYSFNEKIIENLLKKGLLDLDILSKGLQLYFKEKPKESFFVFLYKRNLISEKLYKIINSEMSGIPFYEKIQPEIPLSRIQIPLNYIQKGLFFPIKESYDKVVIAITDILSWEDEQIIRRYYKNKKISYVLTNEEELKKQVKTFENYHRIKELYTRIKKELNSNIKNFNNDEFTGKSAVVELIEFIIKNAIEDSVSDIHIEAEENIGKIRFRKFGTLYKFIDMDKDIYTALVSRLKIMARVDVSEKRKPQDGSFSLKINNMDFDFRFSSLPTVWDESIVIRILDKRNILKKITDIGISKNNLEKILTVLKKPNGIFLVTGPTGSGKSTTLYASLNATMGEDIKVITVEDPVEYKLNGIQQVQVNQNTGLTFPAALRSILRQDPDVIMIGEIRDEETLEIAIKAALTGHLVISTLHTNDAVGAISRMIDMGAKSYMVAASLVGIEAQRLVRTNCPYCSKEYKPDEILLKQIEPFIQGEDIKFIKGMGCEKCNMTGFSGRTLITEIFLNDSDLEEMISKNKSKNEILNFLKKEKGYKTMFFDGLEKVKQGLIPLEEIFAKANI